MDRVKGPRPGLFLGGKSGKSGKSGRRAAVLVAAAIALVGCSNAPVRPPAARSTTVTGGPVVGINEAKAAVLRVIPSGEFSQPDGDAGAMASSLGSGFIIDSSGLAVTSSRLVAGAEKVTVVIGGQTNTRTASVVGVSECDGLAVIDVDGGNYPYLSWSDAQLRPETPVAAAGFLSQRLEYQLSRGSIGGTPAPLANKWLSADEVATFSGQLDAGAIGGPMLDSSGRVVGVLASPSGGGALATVGNLRGTVESLSKGGTVPSLGIGAVEVEDTQRQLRGIWITGVHPGSAADIAGLAPGDVITSVGGTPVDDDGTMKSYCDAIKPIGDRSDILIQAVRSSTGTVVEGSTGGSAKTGAGALDQAATAKTDPRAARYAQFRTISDNSRTIRMRIPVDWGVVDKRPSAFGPAISATTNFDDFQNGWSAPGVFMLATRSFGANATTEMYNMLQKKADCTVSEGQKTYDDNTFTGVFEIYRACGNKKTDYVVIAATPHDDTYVVGIAVQIVGSRDWDALSNIIRSFQAIGPVPAAP